MKYVAVTNAIRHEAVCLVCRKRFVVSEGKSMSSARCPDGCTAEALRVGAVVDRPPRLLQEEADCLRRRGMLT